MPIKKDSLNRNLYDLLNTRGYDPISMDSDVKNISKTVPPEEAEVFKFTFKQDDKPIGTPYVSIDDSNTLVVYYDQTIADQGSERSHNVDFDDSWYGLLKFLKKWAYPKQMKFELKNKDELNSDMAKRTYMKNKERISEGYYPINKNTSYSDNIPSVKIILQHSRQIQENEQRYRNISKIYLENQNGERFLAPTTRPGIAQVYARHLAEGGLVNDEHWNHIKSLTEEYTKMAGFVRAVRNNVFNESAQLLVNEGVNHYQKLRETLGRLRSHRGYNQYFESYTPTLMEDDGDDNSLNELFVRETLDPRIESVIPILLKLNKNISEMKEVDTLADWANNVLEEKLKQGLDEATDPLSIPEDDESDEEHYLGTFKGPKKSEIPAIMRKAKGKGWQVTAQDLDKEQARNISSKEWLTRDDETNEDLGPEQKRVGQLGPTEKASDISPVLGKQPKQHPFKGKLVGASENFINQVDQAVVTENDAPQKWRATVEYGPTAADAHFVSVTASSEDEAKEKVEAWCKRKGIRNPMITINGADRPQGVAEDSGQNLSIEQLATISDEALDNAYHYGRSTPGNTFGWQANLKSAEFAKRVIDAGVTDIDKISDAIHKGWNVTAKAFVQDPDQFDDTAKLKAAGKLEAKLQQREKLMNINYSQLPDEEQEKDRVVARALLQAIRGEQGVAEGSESGKLPSLSRTQYGLIRKLRSAVSYKGQNIPYNRRVKFTDLEKNGIERLLRLAAPSDSRGAAILMKAADGYSQFDPSEKPIIDKTFNELLQAPMRDPGLKGKGASYSGPGVTGDIDPDAFAQGFNQSFQQGMNRQPTQPAPMSGQTPPPAPGTMANPIRLPPKFMGPAQTAFPRLREEGVEEGASNVDQVIKDLIDGKLDPYDVLSNPNGPAQVEVSDMLQSMYDDVSIDHHLHPDDDFEEILDIVMDRLEQDHGNLDEDLNEGQEALDEIKRLLGR